MKLLLKDFQVQAVDRLVNHLRRASIEAQSGDLQAVSLFAPTGSGKTIIATAAIERLLEGDGRSGPFPDATFLWVSDQPNINEQTRRKMLEASSTLGPSNLVIIDAASFDQETFTPSIVYFLNIQKLGKDKNLITKGDERDFTIWETINNTLAARPGALYVFIDEAHRGMSENPRERSDAATITQKFIKGAQDINPVLLIVGISATIDRFNRLVEGTPRIARPVNIEPEEVRTSGLLKEVITFYHPTEEQPSDMTMLRAAARSWQFYCRRWVAYCADEGEGLVSPLLLVQVRDGTRTQISATDIAEAVAVINNEVGELPPQAFAHAFQEGNSIGIGGQELRYLAPADIDEDEDVQVVFFKTSLNTGWDCPRAEVMMSFRTALDATSIAQLVGRMVRTPLARRIDADEFLNTVSLYLPHYDKKGLENVVNRLTAPDYDIMPPIKFESGEDSLVLNRAPERDAVFSILTDIPSYVVPSLRKSSEVRRLMKLARLLALNEIDPDAPDKATEALLSVLNQEYEKAKHAEHFKSVVEEKKKLSVRSVNWRFGTQLSEEDETIELDVSSENIDDLFDMAGRTIGEGLHKLWWRARVSEEPTARSKAKLEIFALSQDSEVIRKLEAAAKSTTVEWLGTHRHAVAQLPEGHEQAYTEVRRLASDPEETTITYPQAIEVSKSDNTWNKHLYVDQYALFPASFNSWETKVLEEEIPRDDVIGWLRNPDRKPWSFCVPYKNGGNWHSLYPDFLIVRSTLAGLVVDLLDPHDISREDAPAKAVGLAEYASKHWHNFGRIEIIIVDGNQIKRLDLTNEAIRNRVKTATTHQHLRQLFEPV